MAVAPTSPAFLVRFRPTGPWRVGPDSGARDRVDRIYHSDSMYSAVSSAMRQLGMLDEWLQATAHNTGNSAVRFSSCFPFQGDTLYVVPPSSMWPPAASGRVRWRGAQFVPMAAVESLVAGNSLNEEDWFLDGASECLLPAQRQGGATGPIRIGLRTSASVDRLGNANTESHSAACLEFAPESGLWALVVFADVQAKERWSAPVESALRLLADSGFGGERARGWGGSEEPRITEGTLPGLILTNLTTPLEPAPNPGDAETLVPSAAPEASRSYWLLSLFSPGDDESIDWKKGKYSVVTRNGRVESLARWGDRKKPLRMVREGSVLVADSPPRGVARDVAPDGFPHPVFRAGFALAVPLHRPSK